MSRIIVYLFLMSFLLYQSCRSGFPAIEENEEKIIKLSTPSKELYDTCIVIKIIKVENYEVHIQLSKLSNYVLYHYDGIYKMFLNKLNNYSSGLFDGKFDFVNKDEDNSSRPNHKNYPGVIYLRDSRFFESGEYFIYNTKTKEYEKKVEITIKFWYDGPLAASYDYIVKVNNSILYIYSVMS